MAKKRGHPRSKSVDMMIESFMDLHKQGYSISQIAQKFGISESTVYNSLQEIADRNGVTRESLLERESSPHSTTQERVYNKLNVENLFNELEETIKHTRNLLSEVNALLEEFDRNDNDKTNY